jgi:hypothetical protein
MDMERISMQGVEREPDAAARRMMRTANNRDGLPEIAIGICFLTVTFLVWLEVAFRPGSLAYRASWWGMLLLLCPMIAASPWAVKAVRRRFLLERVGYVEMKPIPRRRSMLVIVVAFVTAIVTTLGAYRGAIPPASWLLAGIGIGGGLLMAQAGRLPRFVAGGMVMAALGIALAFSRMTLEAGSLVLYGSMGVLSLFSGCVVLVRFLRVPQEDA